MTFEVKLKCDRCGYKKFVEKIGGFVCGRCRLFKDRALINYEQGLSQADRRRERKRAYARKLDGTAKD